MVIPHYFELERGLTIGRLFIRPSHSLSLFLSCLHSSYHYAQQKIDRRDRKYRKKLPLTSSGVSQKEGPEIRMEKKCSDWREERGEGGREEGTDMRVLRTADCSESRIEIDWRVSRLLVDESNLRSAMDKIEGKTRRRQWSLLSQGERSIQVWSEEEN